MALAISDTGSIPVISTISSHIQLWKNSDVERILSLYTTIFSTKVFNIFLTILSSLDLRYLLKFKDDFLFFLNSYEAKSTASQGEKKSIIFSLKLSEIDMVLREKKESPILIIDDISSYFDSNRKDSILNYLEKRNIQVFISSTGGLGIDTKDFYVEKGEISYDRDREYRENDRKGN